MMNKVAQEAYLADARCVIETVYHAIKMAGKFGIPSGSLYSRLVGYNISLQAYEAIILLLTNDGRIKSEAYLLSVVD